MGSTSSSAKKVTSDWLDEDKKESHNNLIETRLSTASKGESDDDSEETDYRVFCGIGLNPGVSGLNIVSFFIVQFITFVCLNFILGYVTFILEDPDYYNLTPDEVAANLGVIASYAEVVVIFA